ncbi:hypothetical protein FE904_14785 [Chryseobacterium indologenes]|uniref:hypothetical protein n=1 Tax=Chryseobacterium TaxID=59732 RepID=UPI0003E0657E|nr:MULTISPECIES: hypothetical protein [Chryseobacterium]TLX24918.1 hypothetical protein FE904_14785 [Chryseobacterium indologenes]GAE63302.1 hypothetical protein CIN01S_03_01300 [Chryseobacterium indologenes NBRC 14944]SFJ14564.1 hypothetical protein SAMN05421692_1225 [Chryseobacterium indologenes]SUX49184.1 Uncharacterised protein [Chryseobacterium indologenes]
MLKKTSLLVLLSAAFLGINAQQTIPFRITKSNNIILKTLVNKKDSLDLMFQIAMKDGAISPEKQRKTDHIIFNKDEISDGNTVELGKLSVQNIRFTDNQLAGQGADGKIGTALFEGKSFKIDYDNNQFVVYDTLPDVKGYQPVPVFYDHDAFYIVADNVVDGHQQQEGYFALQSGYSGGILYSNDFAEEKELDKKLKVIGEKTLKNSAGQSIITKQAILPFFKLGDFVFKNISVGFFAGELKTQNVSYFGADMLRRFVWIFDAERKTAYIKPSRYYSEPYYKIN